MLWLGSGLSVFSPVFSSAQGSINLSWLPSPDTDVTGYNIYYGTSSRSYTNETSLGNTTSATISGLVGGMTYYFAATAYDSAGDESDFSNEISYNVPTSVIFLSGLKPGSFGGLFYEQDAVRLQSSGGFNLSVTAAGKYSGSLQMSAGKFAFSGQFGTMCQATNHIARKNTNALVLSFSLGSSNQVLGSISDGLWTANLYGERTGIQLTNYGLSVGKYTMVIPGINNATNSLGHGFGTLTLNSAGSLRFGGTLADGTKFSQSALVSEYGNWPLFVPLYSGKGLVISWIAITNSGGNSDLSGVFNWIKPANTKSLLYQSGLAVQQPVMGSFYLLGTNPVPTIADTRLLLSGALAHSTNQMLSLSFSKANGTFTGQLKDSLSGRPVAFQGALLQNFTAGYGFVLGTNLSSPVRLIPSTP